MDPDQHVNKLMSFCYADAPEIFPVDHCGDLPLFSTNRPSDLHTVKADIIRSYDP